MRLLTRSDFDGLMCAVLLKEMGVMDERKFVHPKDIQDGLVEADENDVLANVPYLPGCGLWFDHHASEVEREEMFRHHWEGACDPGAKSCARVIFDYYGGAEGPLARLSYLVDVADKADSADFSREEILNPEGWVLLSFVMDPRTGLGRFRDYRISNYQLMDDLVEYLRNHDIDEILALEDVEERVVRYRRHQSLFREMLTKKSRAEGDAIVIDFVGNDEAYVGNRHIEYALYPDQNISVWLFDGKNAEFCVISVGHSILNRTSSVDVGKLMLRFGGGGHFRVGTCQIPYEDRHRVLEEILEEINDGSST
ncbi:exopolyphosphatase [Dethiosulfovibrio sp. F2B]|uniref:exopolyphosphatase n=1 Tax=Dethiosulfovibrio faecalis TaxID=2720018 RepID=UPI001F2DDFFB|nr:exopolyphosphatase [Dethiosulfovibrio faecalis]MCF4152324.1 exopolyphosphatase [Dethiosulfovibrio faecalis]